MTYQDRYLYLASPHCQVGQGHALSLLSPLHIKGEKGEGKYFSFLLFLSPQLRAQLPFPRCTLTRKFPHLLLMAHAEMQWPLYL